MDAREERRSEPRNTLFQPIEWRGADGTPRRAYLLDLSTGGVLIHSSAPPSIGAALDLALGGAWRSMEVCWAEPRHFGARFDVRIEEAEVDAIFAEHQAMLEEATVRLDLTARWGLALRAAQMPAYQA